MRFPAIFQTNNFLFWNENIHPLFHCATRDKLGSVIYLNWWKRFCSVFNFMKYLGHPCGPAWLCNRVGRGSFLSHMPVNHSFVICTQVVLSNEISFFYQLMSETRWEKISTVENRRVRHRGGEFTQCCGYPVPELNYRKTSIKMESHICMF